MDINTAAAGKLLLVLDRNIPIFHGKWMERNKVINHGLESRSCILSYTEPQLLLCKFSY